jgi:hypothetical protein
MAREGKQETIPKKKSEYDTTLKIHDSPNGVLKTLLITPIKKNKNK